MKTNLIITMLLSILLIGCTKKETHQIAVAEKQITVLSSFYPMHIIAKNLTQGISSITAKNLTPPQTGCLHDYQLKPEDLVAMQNTDYFIVNGAGMESFIQKVIDQYPNMKVITASENLPLLKNESDGEENPHLFVSISAYIEQVKNVTNQLVKLDTLHSKQIQQNSDIYLTKLSDLKTRMHAVLDSIPNKNIVTFHEAFPYFAKEFNMNIAAIIEREPGSEPSAGELTETIKIINKSKVKALFSEPQYSPNAAETIAKETSLKVYTLDPSVNGEDNLDAYIKIMEKNLETLKEALK